MHNTNLHISAVGESTTDPSESANEEYVAASSDPKTCPIIPGNETSIEIEKGRTGLGLSIVGGSDTLLVSLNKNIKKNL